MVLSEVSVGALRRLKSHVDKGYLSNAAEIALLKDHLLANREVPQSFWSNTEALGQLKSEDFITEEQHTPQISALVQDAISSNGSSNSNSNSSNGSNNGSTSARATAMAQPQRTGDNGTKRSREEGGSAAADTTGGGNASHCSSQGGGQPVSYLLGTLWVLLYLATWVSVFCLLFLHHKIYTVGTE